MRQLMTSPVRAQSRRTTNNMLGLMMGLMLLTSACDEAQALNSLAGGGENVIGVASSPEA